METILHQTQIKARKKHKCNYCSLDILIGETYLKAVYKYDNIYTWKNHLSCQKIADKLKMFDDCDEGLTGDHFMEIINQEFNNIHEHSVNDFAHKLQEVLKHYNINP